MSKSKDKSKLEEWAEENYRCGPLGECDMNEVTQVADWLLERAREWCEKPYDHAEYAGEDPMRNGNMITSDALFAHLEQLCGKEGK